MMTLLYKLGNNLYVNLTNRCPCSCIFCLRQTRDEMDHSGSLWLEREPSLDEVKAAFTDFPADSYDELVFCGFGEPTERLDILLETASYVKENFHKKIRLNTNGLGNLIHEKDITPLFKGKVDCISISLNTPDASRYYELTRSKFGLKSFDALLTFAKDVKKYVPEVILSTVSTTLTKEEEEKCQKICDDLGVTYRIRPFED